MPFLSHFRVPLVVLALTAAPASPALRAAALPGLAPVVAAPIDSPVADLSSASVADARAALAKEIATTRTDLAGLAMGGPDATSLRLTQESALLERIDAVYAEQQRTLQHAADLAAEAVEIAERIRSQRPPESSLKPPYGMALLDQLYGERDYLEQAVATLKRDVENSETALQEARDTAKEKDRLRRAARTAAEKAGEEAILQGDLRRAELESRLALETVRLNETALKTLKLQQSLLEPKQRLLQPRFAWLRGHLALDTDEIGGLRRQQQKRSGELERAVAAAQQDAQAVALVAIATERRGATEQNADELESRRADRQTADLTVSVLTAQRERLAEAVTVAEQRRNVLSGKIPAQELRALAQRTQEVIDQLARDRRREGSALYRSRRELQDGQARLSRAAASDAPSPAWTVARMKRLAAWIELSQAEVADIDRLRTAHSRLQEEIGAQVNLFSWRDAFARATDAVAGAWRYEVFSVQDQPVRLNTILAGLLLVVFGHRAAHWASALLARTLLRRMAIGRRAAWQTLWFYALFLAVLLTASSLFRISLTQFSVVSGALAVGIGFGSQNLISNFISGVILLLERPVNQGDVIEIDGLQVTVERLGARSTIVRTRDNTQMIVPNSRLLEQPVINWTLSDDIVRRRIAVGVAYESPTRQVAALLQGAVASMETVRKDPVPLVVFADFGENSLLFELYFWVGLADAFTAENELRHRIAGVFAQERIVMAFPQRDVHLGTTKPLEVMIRRAPDRGVGPESGAPP